MTILAWILFGLIVGLVARLLVPGPQPGGLAMTIVLGIVGALLGGWLGQLSGLYPDSQFGSFLMSVLGAVVVLLLSRVFLTSRSRL